MTRDIDLLQQLAKYNAASVCISVTTLDVGLNRVLEPRTSLPAQRLAAIQALTQAGIPTGVLVAPIIPGLTEHEIPSILDAVGRAGARFAGYTIVRLPYAVRPLFEQWLQQHFPDRKDKVLNRIRAMRGGQLNRSEFGKRMSGEGPYAEQIESLFAVALRKAGLSREGPELSTAAFRRPAIDGQLRLFE